MRSNVAHGDRHLQLLHSFVPWGHQRHRVAIGIMQSARRSDAALCDRQMPVSGRRRRLQRITIVIDLENRVADTVPQLMHTASDRQRFLKRQADFTLPEREHRLLVRRVQPDIDGRLCDPHGLSPSRVVTWVFAGQRK
jgi:hypothetical protein